MDILSAKENGLYRQFFGIFVRYLDLSCKINTDRRIFPVRSVNLPNYSCLRYAAGVIPVAFLYTFVYRPAAGCSGRTVQLCSNKKRRRRIFHI